MGLKEVHHIYIGVADTTLSGRQVPFQDPRR